MFAVLGHSCLIGGLCEPCSDQQGLACPLLSTLQHYIYRRRIIYAMTGVIAPVKGSRIEMRRLPPRDELLVHFLSHWDDASPCIQNTVPFFSIVGVGMLRVSPSTPLLSSPAFPRVGVCRASSGFLSIVTYQRFTEILEIACKTSRYVFLVHLVQVAARGYSRATAPRISLVTSKEYSKTGLLETLLGQIQHVIRTCYDFVIPKATTALLHTHLIRKHS